MRMLELALCLCVLCCSRAIAHGQKAVYTDSLLHAMSSSRSDTSKANILLRLSAAYVPGDVAKEFYYAKSALSVSEKAGWDDGKMYAEQLIGDCYNRVKGYHDAIMHFKLGIVLSGKLKRTDVEAGCLQQMAFSYRGLGDMRQTIICQHAAVDLAEGFEAPDNLCQQMRELGLFLSEAGRYREAITLLLKDVIFAEVNFDGKKKMDKVADLLNIIAGAYIKTDQADSALYYLRVATGLAAQTGNYSLNAYIHSTFCDVYTSTGVYDSAIIYGEQTIRMGEALHNIDIQQYYCKTLSRIYEDNHNPLRALYYHKKFDSLINIIDNTQKMIDQTIQLTKINIDQQAERNKLEKRSSEVIRHNQQAALIAALVAMVALIALTTFIYRNLRQKQKANKIISLQAASLQDQNEIIEKSLKEKEVLLKETHHRVKNNLQLISSLLELQVANLEDESAKNALRSAQNRVLSIASVHSKLYGSDEDEAVEFSAFVSDLFTRLHSAFAGGSGAVQFENEIPVTFFPLSRVVLLGLILNELITNSFKHAFTGAAPAGINISLEQTGANCTLWYYDSGPGLPDGVFSAPSGSLWLYLVRRLSKQLKGNAAYKYDRGSTFTIIFPNAGS